MSDDPLPDEQQEKIEKLKQNPEEQLRFIVDHYYDLITIRDKIDTTAFQLQDGELDNVETAEEANRAWARLWDQHLEVRKFRNQFENIWKPIYEDRFGMDFTRLVDLVEEHGVEHVVEQHLDEDAFDGS